MYVCHLHATIQREVHVGQTIVRNGVAVVVGGGSRIVAGGGGRGNAVAEGCCCVAIVRQLWVLLLLVMLLVMEMCLIGVVLAARRDSRQRCVVRMVTAECRLRRRIFRAGMAVLEVAADENAATTCAMMRCGGRLLVALCTVDGGGVDVTASDDGALAGDCRIRQQVSGERGTRNPFYSSVVAFFSSFDYTDKDSLGHRVMAELHSTYRHARCRTHPCCRRHRTAAGIRCNSAGTREMAENRPMII